MSHRRAVALVALVPLFAACATQPPDAAVAPSAPAVVSSPLAAPQVEAEEFPEPMPSPTASPTPSATTATPKPSPSSAKTSPTAKATKASASPTATKSAAAKSAAPASVDASACTGSSLALNAKGDCVTVAQKLLAAVDLFSASANGTFGQSTANAVLNYQRSRGISDNAIIGPETWAALTSGKAAQGGAPAACSASGVVLCASKGARTLTLMRDGQAVKTINVRFGGMTKDDNGKLRIFPTVSGKYSVYAKDAKAFSDRWESSMPYSIKFNPNMYVHYSGDFAKRGYAGSSHGCINVGSMSDAKWFFDNTPVGAKVVVY
ncbi:MAG TPA: L,D-transpeptidase family protein [Propioniciclava sp.]|jgi:hypothetical protein|uniref:L,D-transpeptidase family protein n=1 Tax=Propioniciclava sp. TaxID=2038686 RepID=UPI002BA8D883|nr:L,D-transpeptidase family protein [Propioniciclava sp.]HRL50686.1 L,D-transpeptidase family protein [Propioniciclava sp.]